MLCIKILFSLYPNLLSFLLPACFYDTVRYLIKVFIYSCFHSVSTNSDTGRLWGCCQLLLLSLMVFTWCLGLCFWACMDENSAWMELFFSRWHLFLSLLRTRCYFLETALASLRILAKVSSLPFMDRIPRITVLALLTWLSLMLFFHNYISGKKSVLLAIPSTLSNCPFIFNPSFIHSLEGSFGHSFCLCKPENIL